jgi:WD40 repeat protein/class 3 adenylate cyclase
MWEICQAEATVMESENRLTDDQRRAVEEFRKRHRTAVLALLFTDVERSTALKQDMGEIPASALLARHSEAIRQTLAGFSETQEVSTAGDSFFTVFAKPSDAVRFALLAQLRLRELATQSRPDFRVRMGIHLGEVAVQEDIAGGAAQDVLGIQVDLAARVSALAQGGQILMTRGVFDNARQILKGQLLPGIGELSWLSHGPYLLKGFDEPQAICEVGEAGIAPLAQPPDSVVAQRATVPGTEPVLGWRPAVEQTVPATEWQLEEKLGEGGFGEVWLARHRRTKEQRVFKFCFRADRLRSLKREMTLFRALKEVLGERPDIARLYNVQFEEAPYYLELEYTPGGNLADWLSRKAEEHTTETPRHREESSVPRCLGGEGFASVVPLSLRLEIVAQIATALAAAHSVGVIHKDVKPSNVLVEARKDGSVQIRLTDFGIAQLKDRQVLIRAGITAMGFTETIGAIAESTTGSGTRLYMAPELIAGHAPTTQSDIYSLGVLLYQMLVGDFSQPLTTDWERHVADPLLRDDLHRCLAGDPSERFGNAGELAEGLRSLSQRRAALAEREAAQRAAARRRRLAVVLTAAAGLLLLVVLALGYGLYREQVQRAAAEAAEQKALREKDKAEQQFYFANIALAEKCIEELRYDAAGELLTSCPKQYRHWEWGRLQYLCNLDLMTLKGHTRTVRSVAFSPDGKRLATASYDSTAKLWDPETDTGPLTLRSRYGSLYSIAFSPDGTRVAASAYGGPVEIWNTETGRACQTLLGHTAWVLAIAFSPDGKYLTSASDVPDRTAKLWDLETSQPLLTFAGASGTLMGIAFSPDGKYIATAALDNVAQLWDPKTGLKIRDFRDHSGETGAVAFSPDGKYLATANWDNTARIWEVETGRDLRTFKGHSDALHSVRFSPDGKWLATASGDKTARIWDVETGQQLVLFQGHSRGLCDVAFCPSGQRLLTGSEDGTAKVWDVETSGGFRSLAGHLGAVSCLAFSRDGNRLVTGGGDWTVRLWDTQAGHELLKLRSDGGMINSVALSPDGRRLAAGFSEGTAKIWDLGTGKELRVLRTTHYAVRSVALDRDGTRVAIGGDDWTVRLWDVEAGLELLRLRGDGAVQAVRVSPDGKWIAAGFSWGTAKLWDAETGDDIRTFEGHTAVVRDIAFNRDGKRLATASGDYTAKIWDVETGRETAILKGHSVSVQAVAFSPDGKRLAMACGDKTAKLWDVETGRQLLTLKGHGDAVRCVAFSPAGDCLATGGDDNRTILWSGFPWSETELPGSDSTPLDDRIELYKRDYGRKRLAARQQPSPVSGARRVVEPPTYSPGVSLRVRLELHCGAGDSSLTVAENVPPGWSVGSVSGGGRADQNTILWQVAPWTSPGATLEYTATPPATVGCLPVIFPPAVVRSGAGWYGSVGETPVLRSGVLVFQEGVFPNPQ